MSTKLSLVSSVFVALFLMASASSAAPRWIRLSWTIPDATDTTMTVSWTDDDGSGGSVEYRPMGGTSDTVPAAASDTGSDLLDVTYEATLTVLTPLTTYEYRVQSGGSWSEWKTFATAPPLGSCEHVRFVLGGDGRGGEAFYDPGFVSRHWTTIATSMDAEVPLFVVNTGDIVHSGSEDEQWEEWFGLSEFFTSMHPHMPVIGNHDDGPGDGDNQWYNKMFALPRSGAGLFDSSVDPEGDGIEDYWAVVVGNILLVGLSTEGVDPAIQHAFLEETIRTYEAIVDWKFVFFHRPLWSSGATGNNEGDKLDADNLIKIIDDYAVDFVISGHDHDYERCHPARGGYGGRAREINPLPGGGGSSGIADGTIHIVSGGAGSFVIPDFLMTCRVDACHVAVGHLNYMVFDITGDRADVVVRDFGEIPILPWVNAYLRPDPLDTFSVSKASSVCSTTPDETPEEPDIPETVDATQEPDAAEDIPFEPVDDTASDIIPDAQHDMTPFDADQDTTGDGGDAPPAGKGCGCRVIT